MSPSTSESVSSNGFVCVSCMTPSSTLYERYPSFIRVSECKNCGNFVDKYVEYDLVLIVIDLVLQYESAYRHILYNKKITSFIRLCTIFLFCGAYDKWIRSRAGQEALYDLEWRFYQCLLESCVEIGSYVFCSLLIEFYFNRSMKRAKFVSQAAVAGYYGNVCVVLSIIFNLSSEPSYRILTQLFLLISHVQIFRALHPSVSLLLSTLSVGISLLFSLLMGATVMNMINS